jgi:hypothetical protein
VWRTCVWVGNGDRALHQGDVEIQFYCVATRPLDAGIGDQADQDHPGNAMLPELDVEVGVGEAVLAPIFPSAAERNRDALAVPTVLCENL